MFQGYSDETLDFLWGVRFNNDRAWFQEHKEDYLTYCDNARTAAVDYDFANLTRKLIAVLEG